MQVRKLRAGALRTEVRQPARRRRHHAGIACVMEI